MSKWPDDWAVHTALQTAFPTGAVELLPRLRGSANRHASVHLATGRLFVKIYASASGFETERAVLRLLGTYDERLLTILPEQSGVKGGLAWQAFPWIDLEPIEFDMPVAAISGKLMAYLHSAPTSPVLEQSPFPPSRVDERLARLNSFPEIHERATKVWAAVHLRVLEELSHYDAPPVLLQNDFGKRNIFRRRDTGQLVVIDFERAGVGDAHWELGKLWDRELHEDPKIRHAFLQGYREQRGLLAEEWPHPALLWLVRFVATLAIFPYATRVGNTSFFEHGLFKLSLVEAEASQWT